MDTPPTTEAGVLDAALDNGGLDSALRDILAAGLGADESRAKLLAAGKQVLAARRREIHARFEASQSGRTVALEMCALVDEVVRTVYGFASDHLYPLANPSTGEVLSLVAIGGYGRGELAPQSDIDLLFLLSYKLTPRSEQVIETVLYFLWDLDFKVGHATRSLDDCVRLARGDVTICTSLLESRWIQGDEDLFHLFKRRFQSEVVRRGGAAGFVEAKLDERAQRHERHGGSRYSLEPNIKEGKGGQRDLHTLYWIAKYLYQVDDISKLIERGIFTRREVRRFDKAQEYLWTLRCHLHYLSGRPNERLTFDLQAAMAPRMGYTRHAGTQAVERFMKHYFLIAKDVGNLTRIFCAALEAEHNRRSRFRLPALTRRRRIEGFRVEGDRLNVKGPEVFAEKPIAMLRLFRAAQKHDMDIHPEALRWIAQNLKHIGKDLREDPEANRLFLEIMTSPKDAETTLRRLNEAGIFGRFVPDFGRVVAQMQFNMYHHYTVDEHTIFAIGIAHKIEQGLLKDEVPIASEVVHKILSRRVLYLAILLHDIAKGRGGDHSEVGRRIANKLCPRLGLSAEETETVAWLVLHHLAMTQAAFKRDLTDPQTIADFAVLVQSPERLRLLLVLTVVDIRAVGPGVWNAWKAALLRDLYWRTEEALSGAVAEESRKARVKDAKTRLGEALADWTKKDLKAHLARGYDPYWLSVDHETQIRHAMIVREAEKAKETLSVDTRTDRYREITEVTVYTADHAGLFSRIAGAMAVAGASIDAARIFTLANGMALDTFFVRGAHGGAFDRPDQRARLTAAIEKTLSGRMRPDRELAGRDTAIPSRLGVFKVTPRVLVDNKASARATVIEVNGRDRPGLLYELTLALTRLQLMIHGARISTFGERAVDVFYVKDALGDKIENPARLAKIQKRLLAALGAPAQAKQKPEPKVEKTAVEKEKVKEKANPKRTSTTSARNRAKKSTGKNALRTRGT